MLDLETLDLEGDVSIREGVTLKGKITLTGHDKPLIIPQNTVLENQKTIQ